MRQAMEQRLEILRAEFEKGQARLRELQLQQTQVHETVLRISGAIQVLTELLEADAGEFRNDNHIPESVRR